jgi:hypothetical protein
MNIYPGLSLSETLLQGNWIVSGKAVVADHNTKRIRYLISNVLVKVGDDDSGWVTIYKDPLDGRYWERSFPYSSSHGGGPPTLKCLTPEEVRKKYGINV